MKVLLLGLAIIASAESFARECTFKFKEISLEHGCVSNASNRVLRKNFETAEDCFNEAIQLAKKVPLRRIALVSNVGLVVCGQNGIHEDILYSFVEWKFGSLLNFEMPVSGKVNAQTGQNVNGLQDGNQVFDEAGYLIH